MERSKQVRKQISDLKDLETFLQETADGAARALQNKDIIEAGEKELRRYEVFTTWILQFLIDCLHPGACFPRRNTALEVIGTVVRILNLQQGLDDCAVKCNWKTFFSQLNIRTLIGCLHDSYDVNRCLANDILSMLPRDVYTFTRVEMLRMFNQVLSLAQSPQPDNTNTAPCLLKFLTNRNVSGVVTEALLSAFPECTRSLKNDKCLYALHLIVMKVLISKVEEQLKLAEVNLLDAALNSPLHGTMHCIRETLSTVRLTETQDRPSWILIVDKLINCCFRIANIVGPVVSSSAPEGHIVEDAADHNVMASKIVNELGDASSDQLNNVEKQAYLSQMLLACSWRSMKETMLLLGDIAASAPVFEMNTQSKVATSELVPGVTSYFSRINITDVTGFISSSTIIAIGNMFIHILLSSRHIGAFELAYPGFVKVCTVLWRSEIASLQVLPNKWIDELLASLQSGDASQSFCVTRRSAGIPFYISVSVRRLSLLDLSALLLFNKGLDKKFVNKYNINASIRHFEKINSF